jgi:hypothetical protein
MSTSIGYTNSISGSFPKFYALSGNVKGKALGGGFQGYMPQQVQTTEKGSFGSNVFENLRYTLRNAWNTTYKAELRAANRKQIITPFRAVNNSGDFLSRKNYSSGGPNPTNASRPGYARLIGSIWTNTDTTGIPASSCNVKFVADSSEYTKFRKQRANNQNYNDLSQGGYNNSAYSHLMFVR